MKKLIRLPAVIERTSLKRSTIYEMMAKELFPKPVKLNLRSNGWIESEIECWIETRLMEREAA